MSVVAKENNGRKLLSIYVWKLTKASSRVENGNANSRAPGMISSLGSAPKESTNLAAHIQTIIISNRTYV